MDKARELGGTPIVEHDADEIDALVDHELTLPRRGDPYEFYAKCEMCRKEWHGLARDGCPGITGMIGIASNVRPGVGYA